MYALGSCDEERAPAGDERMLLMLSPSMMDKDVMISRLQQD